MTREIKYSLKYFPPEVELIKTFARANPWAQQFVMMKALGEDTTYENVVIAMGPLYVSDGGQVNLEYDIAAVPDNSGIDMEDIVAGRGDTFKDLRNEVDFTISGMLNAIIAEVSEEGPVEPEPEASKILLLR